MYRPIGYDWQPNTESNPTIVLVETYRRDGNKRVISIWIHHWPNGVISVGVSQSVFHILVVIVLDFFICRSKCTRKNDMIRIWSNFPSSVSGAESYSPRGFLNIGKNWRCTSIVFIWKILILILLQSLLPLHSLKLSSEEVFLFVCFPVLTVLVEKILRHLIGFRSSGLLTNKFFLPNQNHSCHSRHLKILWGQDVKGKGRVSIR